MRPLARLLTRYLTPRSNVFKERRVSLHLFFAQTAQCVVIFLAKTLFVLANMLKLALRHRWESRPAYVSRLKKLWYQAYVLVIYGANQIKNVTDHIPIYLGDVIDKKRNQMSKDSGDLGNRMKSYEDVFRNRLPIRMPILLRLDGCHFSSYTRGCARPIDHNIVDCMNQTAQYLCAHIQGCQLAYIQSDEITLLLRNDQTFETSPWFDNNIQKMVSVSASMASVMFTSLSGKIWNGVTKPAFFDSRAFVLPKEDVMNGFEFRQQDAVRNSVQSLALSLFSHSQLNSQNVVRLKEMCASAGVVWDDLPTSQKQGRCVVKVPVEKVIVNKKTNEQMVINRPEWQVDNEIPIFSKEPDYINKYLEKILSEST